jgi:hypothetical protein
MDSLWLALFWTGPIGIGIFLMSLGVLFWSIGKLRSKKE